MIHNILRYLRKKKLVCRECGEPVESGDHYYLSGNRHHRFFHHEECVMLPDGRPYGCDLM